MRGLTTLPGPFPSATKRLAAVSWVVRIYAKPSRQGKVVGFLRAGAVVATRGTEKSKGRGCRAGWQGVQPTGYVCLDDATAELDHPIAKAAARRPDYAHRLPYMYGTVTRGGPVYVKVPSEAELKRFEPNLKRHYRKWREDEVSGAHYGLDVWLRYSKTQDVPDALQALEQKASTPKDIPPFLRGGQRAPLLRAKLGENAPKAGQVNRRQGRSFIHSFLHQGRRYNVTPDLLVIPADRFRPIRGSDQVGYPIESLRQEKAIDFPFAIVRRKGARKWLRKGKKMVRGEQIAYRSLVQLSGKQRFFKKRLHYQTKEGFYLDDRHASRIDPARRWPKWAKLGQKWIDINLTKQILVAYEGKTMVFATLISSGEAGLTDSDTTTATKRGIFRVHTKHVSITMDSDVVGEEFELRDVPYVQYFEGGYALHGAYWHDGFGRPKSHGCINLSPEDARRLFFWTDPPVPHGWHGALDALRGTVVFIHP